MIRTADSLGSVQKTLLLPLWGRAVETRKSSPLLVDPTAAALIGRLGYDFSTIAAHIHPITRLAWIARAIHIDRTVATFLVRRPRATIVNLGCGLDTTFERVDNGQLTWVDLDLPDVIELRESLIPAGPRRRSLACSLLAPGWLEGLTADEGLILLAAGVLYYLDEKDVRVLLSRLATRLPGAELVFDVCSERGARIANKRVIEDGGMDASATLRWGVDRPWDLASWDSRIELLEAYHLFRGVRARLPWKARFGTWLADRLNIMSMVHLRFASSRPGAQA